MQLERPPRKSFNAARVLEYISYNQKTYYLYCKVIEEHRIFRTRVTHGKAYD